MINRCQHKGEQVNAFNTEKHFLDDWCKNFSSHQDVATYLSTRSDPFSQFACLSRQEIWECFIDTTANIRYYDFKPLVREFAETICLTPRQCYFRMMDVVERGYPVAKLKNFAYEFERQSKGNDAENYAYLYECLMDIQVRQNIIDALYQVVPYMFEDGLLMSRKQRKI